MPDFNQLLNRTTAVAREGAGHAARLGTQVAGVAIEKARGLLNRDSEPDRDAPATAARPVAVQEKPKPAARKPASPRAKPTPKPKAAAAKPKPAAAKPKSAAAKPAATPKAEPTPAELAASGAGRQPAPLGSTEPGTNGTGSSSS
jgi:outer membrane biosynthesis protein TonB